MINENAVQVNHAEMYNGLKVLAVAMRKGGVGKTLISVLLAQYFGHISNSKKKVLMIDLDTQQNASETLLDMESAPHMSDHKLAPIHPDYDPEDPDQAGWDGRSTSADIFYEGIIAPYPTNFENLDVLPAAGDALQAVELVRKEDLKREIYDRLRHFFEDPDVQKEYDLVIVDTPPSLGAINRSMLRAATHVLYPVVLEEKPMNGLIRMIRFAEQENRHREVPIEVVGVVPNIVNMQTNLHRENLEALKNDKIAGPYLTDFVIGKRIDFAAVDKPDATPDNIWKFSGNNAAREDAFRLCEFVEHRLFES